MLEVDPARLAQVLSNLLNNAAKYTDEEGQISLSAEQLGKDIIIRVRDTGIGIAPDILPKIFDLFTQYSIEPCLDHEADSGIGLTLVRSLVELHGGRVTAQSKGLGQGSEFVVRLPVATGYRAGPHRSTAADHLANAKLPSRRILVVDDKRSNAQSLEVLLRDLGQEVYTAYDGIAALELARQHLPDVVLLDIGLPIVDGYEVVSPVPRRARTPAAWSWWR